MSLTETIHMDQLLPREAEILKASPEECTAVLAASGGGLSIPQIKTSSLRYLIGDVEVLEDQCAAMMFRCFVPGKEEERLFFRFGLLPRFRTRICLDLSLLDNRTIYTRRTPGLLKLVVHGQRTERSQVSSFELGVKSTFHDVKVRLENFYLSDQEPEEYPTPDRKLVDEFGQWKDGAWPGKIQNLEELKKSMDKNLGPASYPCPSWNRWGGDSGRKLKEGTGFFSTCKTPDGR